VPDHPEREQLAAFQAGDGDRKQRAWVEAHLAGCRSCTQVVAAVEHARGRLALLAEPELPAGLHDRLAAALDAEAARPLPARARRVWYRRPAAWGAAAAAVLLVALAVPLLHLDRGRDLATAGGGQATQEAARPAAAGGPLPMIPLAGELTTGRLQVALHNNPVARQALERAKAGGLAAPQGDQGVGRAGAPETAAGADAGDAPPPSAAAGARDATADQQACLAAATAQAGHQLLPAFLVAGSYRGQPATVLVTATPGSPSQAEFWAFSRGDCSGPPLASGRLR
jgi:anti-sigma factor RsiW